MKIEATHAEMQMLASCVYSSKMAAMAELAQQTKIANPSPIQIERTGALGELVQFCDMFLQQAQGAHKTQNPAQFIGAPKRG